MKAIPADEDGRFADRELRAAWWPLSLFTLISTLSYLDRQVMTLMIAPIERDLHLTDTQVSLLIGFMFVIFYLAVGIPLSRIIDRGRRTWILGAGVAFWSVMTALCGTAGNFWQLASARMGVGLGESCNTPAVFSMLSDMVRREKLGSATSIIGLGVSLGSGIALFIGGWLLIWLTHVGRVNVPLIGTLAPWQMTFAIVGLPGILIAALMLLTVREPARHGEAVGRAAPMPRLPEVFRYIAQQKYGFFTVSFSVGVRAMLSLGIGVWAPTLFERKFGWKPGVPGLYIGIAYLIASSAGTVVGGLLADRSARCGDEAAFVRVPLWASVGLVPATILFPLMPTPTLSLIALGLSLFFMAMSAGPANAGIQVMAPGRMRATIISLYFALFNLMGFGLGPLAVAQITQRGFADPSMLPEAMCIVACLLSPLALLLSWLAIRPYVAVVRALDGQIAR